MLSVQLSGYIPRSNKTLKNLTKKSTAKCPACLKNSPIIPSGPAALPFFNLWMANKTSSRVVGLS